MKALLKRTAHRTRRRLYQTVERDSMEVRWIPTYAHHLNRRTMKDVEILITDSDDRPIEAYVIRRPH